MDASNQELGQGGPQTVTVSDRTFLSAPEDIIADAKAGKMFILVDDENRENEGDLIIPAQMATAEAINFMARFGRGLICLALTPDRCGELNLPLMSRQNTSRHETAFTVSIEAREGITTGISAADRAKTVAVAVDPDKGPTDLASPGHVFPLMSRDGGVLVRAGHTEAAVDVARLAGLYPAGVICEVMKDDGTMARLPDLVEFAQFHGLKVGTIADLIAYRRKTEQLVSRVTSAPFTSRFGGGWTMVVYRSMLDQVEHIALVKGDLGASGQGRPALVRMHAVNLLEDMLGGAGDGREDLLRDAMEMIAAEGQGVVVIIRDPRADSPSERLMDLIGDPEARAKKSIKDPGRLPGRLVDYGLGAQILLDLGVSDMVLLSNTDKTIIGLDGYGLTVVERRPIQAAEK
ncbi:MAG: 3,4-dihydroxy-2-butanone-4-phosphate synthase [Rhodospirillaceae bacterium]